MLRHLLHISLNPFFQALIVAAVIILLVPSGIIKYSVEEAESITSFDKSQFIYADLDHDGQSEGIHTFLNESGNAGVVIRTNLGPDQQRNFRGVYEDKTQRLIIGDNDNDMLDEIFLFTNENDSIFLHALSFGKEPKLFVQNKYIARLGRNLKEPDYSIVPGKVTDMTGDGRGDVVFGINSGFSRYPRNVFIYDVAHDTVLSSPKSGAYFNQICMANLDDDPFDEITLCTAATDNFNEEPMVYHDSSSWMMALDHDLSFLFPAKEYLGTTGNTTTCPILTSDGRPALLCIYKGFEKDIPVCQALLVSTSGETLMKKDLRSEEKLLHMEIIARSVADKPKKKLLGIIENDGLYEIDSKLTLRKIYSIKFSARKPDFIDIDQDGTDEIILPSPDQKKHLIYRNDFTHPVGINFPIQSVNATFSVKLQGKEPPLLSVQGDNIWWLFDYSINPVYRFRFLIYLGIYFIILGFIGLIRKLYSIQIRKRYETERKVAALQLSGIKAQMEPHFIFNVINTIGSSIYRERKDEAYQMVLRFSSMVRSLLSSSDAMVRTLREETDFVTNFLELEKIRFPEVFTYSVLVAGEVDRDSLVPKMIIQLHAENALKHGLRPKGIEGVLEISVVKEDEYLKISISDNGVGRQESGALKPDSTGKGMKLLAQFYETYNKHNKLPIRQEITDLIDAAGNPSGTLVHIWIPIDFNERIY